jgi:foldase protein PrsA
MRLTFAVLALLPALIAHAQAPAPAPLDPNRVIAIVNGEEIRAAEYYRRMEHLPGVGRRVGNGFSELPPGLLTIDQLVTEKLVLQLARERSLIPSDLEVNAEVQERLTENPDLLEMWKNSGRTEQDMRNQIRYELAQFKLITFGVTVTDQEVDRLYRERIVEFTTQKQLKLSVVVVQNPADRALVDADLKAGKPFAEVARTRSVDASKVQGGAYGTYAVTMFNADARKKLEATTKGATTGWIDSQIDNKPAFVLFLVEDIIPQKVEPLTPAVRKRLRRSTMLDRGRIKNDLNKMMLEARRKAKVEVVPKEFAGAYQEFVKAAVGGGSG